LARSAIYSRSGASSRSRITCHRIDGSESISHSITGSDWVLGKPRRPVGRNPV